MIVIINSRSYLNIKIYNRPVTISLAFVEQVPSLTVKENFVVFDKMVLKRSSETKKREVKKVN
jgi:hypothetical protein